MNENFKEVLLKARNHPYVLVTGPQRSGTTIASKIFAKELGYKYIDELDYNVNNLDLFYTQMENNLNIVVQSPAIMHKLHRIYKKYYDKVFFIIMKRPIEDIIASQERIEWGENEFHERLSYKEESVFDMFYGDFMPISRIKYRVWEMFQSNIVDDKQWTYCEYDWLRFHDMFLPKEKRKDFKPKQTQVIPEWKKKRRKRIRKIKDDSK